MAKDDFANELQDLKKQVADLKEAVNTPTAHQLANRRYEKRQLRFLVRIPQHESELWEHLNKQPNKNQYIKNLIAKDMGYKTWDHFKGLVPSEEFRKEWDGDKKAQEIRSKLSQLNTWQDLNDYVDNNEIDEAEWKEIERLFYIDENPTGLGYDMFAVGSLPLKAWNKKTIMRKVNDIVEEAPFDTDIDWNKYSEKTLQKKLLNKSPYGNKNSILNKHIDFYKIDDEAIKNEFAIDYDEPPAVLKKKQ